jgi:L-ascorbate metabolism protein UlaG (beta-lactamase superfamily)
MHITWHGQTCIKLQTKYTDEDITLIADSYRPSKGEFPRSFSPNIALYSRGQDNSVTLSGEPFIIDTLGEFDIKDIMITSLPGAEESIVFKLVAEGINIAYLGHLSGKLSPGTIEGLGKVDILFIPVGGNKFYLDAPAATELINEIEPRIIIPIAYECDTDPNAAPVSVFIKEIGLKSETSDKKLIIKAKDLPQEEMKVITLEKA